MFCRNCGGEIKDNSVFCIKCGYDLTEINTENTNYVQEPSIANTSRTMNDNSQAYYTVKPNFNWIYKFFQHAWKWIILVLWIGSGIEFKRYGIDPDTFRFTYEEVNILQLYPIPIILGTILCIAIQLIFEKMQYNKIEYTFYADRIEYKDGFLNISQKELKYKFVREVAMTKNVIERIFNLGTIHIYTNASSGGSAGRHFADKGNGIVLHCIRDTEKVLSQVKSLIDVIDE